MKPVSFGQGAALARCTPITAVGWVRPRVLTGWMMIFAYRSPQAMARLAI